MSLICCLNYTGILSLHDRLLLVATLTRSPRPPRRLRNLPHHHLLPSCASSSCCRRESPWAVDPSVFPRAEQVGRWLLSRCWWRRRVLALMYSKLIRIAFELETTHRSASPPTWLISPTSPDCRKIRCKASALVARCRSEGERKPTRLTFYPK